MDFGISRVYAIWEEMLDRDKPDMVFVATPDWAHRDPVIGALERGIHVYVEKPLTTSEAESREIVQAVRGSAVKLQVSYNHRWLSAYHVVHDKLKTGELGAPICFYARKNNPITVPTKMLPSWAKDSSPMWFQSSHDIDLVCWWAGDDAPVEVFCSGVKKVLKETMGWDTFDALHGQVRFRSGAIATFEACWTLPAGHPASPDSFMEVITEKSQLHIDRKAEAVELSSPAGLSWPRSSWLIRSSVSGPALSLLRPQLRALGARESPDSRHRSRRLEGDSRPRRSPSFCRARSAGQDPSCSVRARAWVEPPVGWRASGQPIPVQLR